MIPTSTLAVATATPPGTVGSDLLSLPTSGWTQLAVALDTASPAAAVLVTVYLVARLLIPAILIIYATRDASAQQRIALLRDYLITSTRPGRRRPR